MLIHHERLHLTWRSHAAHAALATATKLAPEGVVLSLAWATHSVHQKGPVLPTAAEGNAESPADDVVGGDEEESCTPVAVSPRRDGVRGGVEHLLAAAAPSSSPS